MSELDVCRRLHVFFTYDLGALPLVWHFSSCSVSKVSWTRRGWVQVSSMEMLRWGSCDSREAPPHRINSSVIARDRGPTLTSAHRPTQTGRPLQVSGMSSTQAVTGLLLNKVFFFYLPQYVRDHLFVSFLFPHLSSRCFLVCGTLLSAVSHTLDHLDEWSWRSLQPLCPYVWAGKPLSVNTLGS